MVEKMTADETTIRWFGDWEPISHGEATRVPVPVGEPCTLCKVPFKEGESGYTLPHMSEFVVVQAAPKGAGDRFVRRPYHQPCLMKWMGLPDLEPGGGTLG